jgi:hypothetical protein
MARLFRDNVWKRFGLFRIFISDRGKEFVSKFSKALFNLLNMEHNASTGYHPQTDGQTERMNTEIEKYLRAWIDYKQDDWAEWLSMAEFAINNRVNRSTSYSPFFLNHGRHPRMGVDLRKDDSNESATQFAGRLKRAWEDAESALKFAADAMKRDYDRKRRPSADFQIGEEVLLEATNLTTNRPSKKLDDKRFGPFKILQKIGSSSYKLDIPKTWKTIHPVFNESLLTRFVPPVAKHQKINSRPNPVMKAQKPEWEIEKILDHREFGPDNRKVWKFRVKWKGYPLEESSWEPEGQFTSAKRTLTAYKKKFPKDFPSSRKVRFLEFPRSIFPDDLFSVSVNPDTEPVDTSLPTEAFLSKQSKKMQKQ